MPFRANFDPNTDQYTGHAFQIDPWEYRALNADNNPFRNEALRLNTWYLGPWPCGSPDELLVVIRDHPHVYFRRPVDIERMQKWGSGQKFQISAEEIR